MKEHVSEICHNRRHVRVPRAGYLRSGNRRVTRGLACRGIAVSGWLSTVWLAAVWWVDGIIITAGDFYVNTARDLILSFSVMMMFFKIFNLFRRG
ncbi:MAG: hypothetical protein EKE20_16835 [Candidatus Symbiopectobacterium sp. Dall1.0]|nr:hypothetical protein [Candidatus Symbiopectobacterium sp. Dall1.0]